MTGLIKMLTNVVVNLGVGTVTQDVFAMIPARQNASIARRILRCVGEASITGFVGSVIADHTVKDIDNSINEIKNLKKKSTEETEEDTTNE